MQHFQTSQLGGKFFLDTAAEISRKKGERSQKTLSVLEAATEENMILYVFLQGSF